MPLIVRFTDIPGLGPDETANARDVGTAEFLSLASEVWEALEPEFSAKRLTVYETFPGEHLGGKISPKIQPVEAPTSQVLRRLSPVPGASTIGQQEPRVHSNNSIEVEGALQVPGLPPMLGSLQLNLYRAWAEGVEDWSGAGDIVFDVLKTGVSSYDGLWEACRDRTEAMIPLLKKWQAGISVVSRQRSGKHRVKWAALRETGDANEPPTSGAYLLYRARRYGEASLLESNLLSVAVDELSSVIDSVAGDLGRSAFRVALEEEIRSLTFAPVFPEAAHTLQKDALVAYSEGGSESFVFRDPEGPAQAARTLIRAVKPQLLENVRARLGEFRSWNQTLQSLSAPRLETKKGPRSIDGFDWG